MLPYVSHNELRLRNSMDQIYDYAVVVFDQLGNIKSWNNGAAQMYGYALEEALDMNMTILFPTGHEHLLFPLQLLQETSVLGKVHRELWRIRQDGTLFMSDTLLSVILDDEGELIGYIEVSKDITETQLKNGTIKDSQARYNNRIQQITDYAIILLDEKGIIQNWNEGAEKIKGYTRDEVIGKSFKLFYTAEDIKNDVPGKLLQEAREKGKIQYEGWRLKKDGSKFWGVMSITALHNQAKEVIGFSKVTRDVTQKLLVEQDKEKYLQALELKNKELEQFTYIASHDLQEPLRTIISFTGLLESSLKTDDASALYVDFIKKSAVRMSDLIKGLQDYSRIGTENEITLVDCNKIVENVQHDLHTLFLESEGMLTCHLLPTIKGYKTDIYQLFQNLIGNALKYRSKERAPQIEISAEENGDKWLFRVQDNGIGMNPKFMHKIFLIFQRLHTRDEYPGCGIGLANCKKIVELHGGTIWVESALGAGSLFMFTINKLHT